METNLSRAMTLYDGNLAFLWERPLTLTIMIIAILVLLMPLLARMFQRPAKKPASDEEVSYEGKADHQSAYRLFDRGAKDEPDLTLAAPALQ